MENGDHVENINHFDFTAEIPPITQPGSRDQIISVARFAYSKALEVLSSTGFQYKESLDLTVSDRGFELRFDEADYGFTFGLIDDKIILRRQGSSMERFESWYRGLMPSVVSLVDSVLRQAEVAFQWPNLKVLRAQFLFRVVAYEFRPKPTGRRQRSISPERNTTILPALIAKVPDEHGHLCDPLKALDKLGRVDLTVSRWVRLENGQEVREIYAVEAPANRAYSGLWLTLSVVGETVETGEGDHIGGRSEFDFDSLMNANGLDVFEDLFQGKFIQAFVPDLLRRYQFLTALGPLP